MHKFSKNHVLISLDYVHIVNLMHKGAFTNYVDNILSIIDHLPTPCWHLWRNSFTETRENLHAIVISSTTYLPRLVIVVCECPLKKLIWKENEIHRNFPSNGRILLVDNRQQKVWLPKKCRSSSWFHFFIEIFFYFLKKLSHKCHFSAV